MNNSLTLPEIIRIHVIVFETCWSNTFHKPANYELLHVLDGNFELTYKDGRCFPGAKGDTFLVQPGTLHEDIFESRKDLKILMIHFCWPGQEQLLQSIDNVRINKIEVPLRSELRWTFEHMRNDMGGGELEQKIERTRLMMALLLIYKGINFLPAAQVQINSHHELVVAAKQYVKRNYGDHLTLEQIASHLKVSSCYLSRIFKQECCFNLFEYIEEIRIEEAKKFLRDGRFQVSEVAAMTGFGTSSYFTKVFKKRTNCLPGKFH